MDNPRLSADLRLDPERVGYGNERRALRILKERVGRPTWLISVRAATPDEDLIGVDIVCELEGGINAYVQIKSSFLGEENFLRRFKLIKLGALPIITFVVRSVHNDTRLGDDLVSKLDHLRSRAMSLDPSRWQRWANDIYFLNQVSEQLIGFGSQEAATVWTARLNLISEVNWLIRATQQDESWGLGNGGLILLETVSGPLFLKVMHTSQTAVRMRQAIEQTVFRLAIIVTEPIDAVNPEFTVSGERIKTAIRRWQKKHYLPWFRKIMRNRPGH